MTLQSDEILPLLLYSSGISSTIKCAVEHKILEELYISPNTVEGMAHNKCLNSSALERFFKFLCTLHLIRQDSDGIYTTTQLGEKFTFSSKNSIVKEAALLMSEEINISWSDVFYSLKTDQPAFENIFGLDFFDYLQVHRDKRVLFHAGWNQVAYKVGKELIERFHFNDCLSIADIGGGEGGLLSLILRKYPRLVGFLLEKNYMKNSCTKTFQKFELNNRAHFCPFDAQALLQPKVDVFLMKSFLHLFKNENALSILNFCRENLKDNGRILVIERALMATKPLDRTVFTDMIMLLMTGGRERTTDEIEQLFDSAGFSLIRHEVLPSGYSVYEGALL